MSTFAENLAKIRGDAVYGHDVREAIAEAIEQSDGSVDSKIEEMQTIIDDHMFFMDVERIEQSDDFKLTITGGVE